MIAAIMDRTVPATIRGNGLGMIQAVLGVIIKADGRDDLASMITVTVVARCPAFGVP